MSTVEDTGKEKGVRFAGSADAPEPHLCWHWACSNSALTQLMVLGFVLSPVYLTCNQVAEVSWEYSCCLCGKEPISKL